MVADTGPGAYTFGALRTITVSPFATSWSDTVQVQEGVVYLIAEEVWRPGDPGYHARRRTLRAAIFIECAKPDTGEISRGT